MKSKTLISIILLTSTVLLAACDNPSAANAENKEYKDILKLDLIDYGTF